MKCHRFKSHPRYESLTFLPRLLLVAVILLTLQRGFAAVLVETPAEIHEGVNSVSGIVLAVSTDQISLLQYDAATAGFSVQYYRHDGDAVLSDNPSFAPGETVTLKISVAPEEAGMPQAYVQQITAAEPANALPIETEVDAAVAMTAQLGVEMAPEAESLVSELLVGEPCPADGAVVEASDDTDKFSFGKVVAVSLQSLTVREFDFAKDTDVEVSYQLLPDTEYGNLSEQRPLRIGDDVVLDYREEAGQRLVSTLVRETAEQICRGQVTAIIGSDITVESYCHHLGHVPEIFRVTSETEYVNLTAERPLQLGNQVEIEYENENGLRLIQNLIRKEEFEPDTDAAVTPENDLFSFGEIISIAGEVVNVREYSFAQDAEVELTYHLSPETEYGNISLESPLQGGDRVVVDYQERDGQRCVTTLVREAVGNVQTAAVLPSVKSEPDLPRHRGA